MSEKDNILGRIREALTASAPRPGTHGNGGGVAPHDHRPHDEEFRAWLPEVPESPQQRVDLFERNSTALKSEFIAVGDEVGQARALADLAAREGWERVAAHHGELVDSPTVALALPTVWCSDGYAVDQLEAVDAGITQCDMLVAQTGSVVVTSRSAGGRALSVLPPHHVVLARRSQLVADMPEAFAKLADLYPDGYPSFLSFITGPSRTGDIERILVLGAHGPRKLTIIMRHED